MKFLSGILAVTLLAASIGPAWRFVMPVLDPGKSGDFDETAVKDPSIVFYGGRWHLFYTARGNQKYSLGYVSAPKLGELNAAPRHSLARLSGGASTFAAPQVFYFRPARQWYLIYQTTASNYQPVFSHTATIDQPDSWSAPEPLAAKQEKDKWIDFWVICDDRLAWLFYTRNQREVYAMTTTLNDFPHGFGNPRKVFAGVHEAVHIYRDRTAYAMLFETSGEGGWRHYGLAQSAQLAGPWTLTSSEFASQIDNGWSRDVSHGELIRSGYDEKLEANLKKAQFLIQGMPPAEHKGDYPSLPWRLGLIRNY